LRYAAIVMIALGPVSASAQDQAPATLVPAAATFKAAAFSPQRAFSESAEGKAGLARVEALRTEKTREIENRNRTLQTREQSLEQSTGVLSPEARIQRTNELEKFRIDLQRFIQDAQADVTGLQRDVESAFLVKLKPVVERVAKEKQLQLIFNLDADPIVWSDPSFDITNEVITQLARAGSAKDR
jgi:outer membrane protein